MSCPPPDPAENKQLRRYYFRLAWIIIALVFVFSILNTLILYISAGIIGGGFSKEHFDAGKNIIRNIPVMSAIYSYGFPIAADFAALGTGLLITKCNIFKKYKSSRMSGKDFLRFTALSFGLVTVGSFINIIITAVISAISGNSDFSLEDAAVNIAPVGNPIWLDVIIYLYICLLGPILEELIFRGVLLEGLRRYGNTFGIVMSSVLFGLMHQNFSQCIPAICMGLVWAYMAVKFDSILPSTLLHIINNSMSAILLILMGNIDLSSIEGMTQTLFASVPLLVTIMINMIIRLACMIASIVIIVSFFSSGKKTLSSNEYTKKRTWKYLFTSAPWLLVMAYMLYSTVTSITL